MNHPCADSTFSIIIDLMKVSIIGGGAAGIMAALSLRKNYPEAEIILFDRSISLGRKILVCGAGRCNITNLNLDKSAATHYYGAETNFVQSVFDQFPYDSIVNFFNELGIELYVERKTQIGKLFPITDQAKTVTTLLEDELRRLKIEINLNTECKSINKNGEIFNLQFQKLENNIPIGEEFSIESDYVILSAGGKTYPALGSNGSGYTLAEGLGHKIIGPVPSAVPLVAKNPLSQEANGIKLDIEITSIIDGKEIKTTSDEVMVTQYGFSGPAVLNISREISIHLNRNDGHNCFVKLNFFPELTRDEVRNVLKERWSKRPDQTIEMSLNGLFAPKIPPVILKIINLDSTIKAKELDQNQIEKLVNFLTNFKVQVTDTKGWNEAEFTAGGIDTKEVNLGTLESKIIPKLYLCGEILDVDGDVGGFNLSWAWSSGFVAGKLG
jgi:predicted Rossmann fold flavoprotein